MCEDGANVLLCRVVVDSVISIGPVALVEVLAAVRVTVMALSEALTVHVFYTWCGSWNGSSFLIDAVSIIIKIR